MISDIRYEVREKLFIALIIVTGVVGILSINYDEGSSDKKFTLGNFEVVLRSCDVIHNKFFDCDDIVVRIAVKNSSDNEEEFEGIVNAYQEGEYLLDVSNSSSSDKYPKIKAGHSKSILYVWQLKYDTDVNISIRGCHAGDIGKNITVDVKDIISDSMNKKAKKNMGILKEKRSCDKVTIGKVKVNLAKGWVVDNYSDSVIKLKDNDSMFGGSADIRIDCSGMSVDELCNKYMKEYDCNKSDCIEYGLYKCLIVNDNKHMFFADSVSGVIVVNSSFLTFEDIIEQVDGIDLGYSEVEWYE